MTPPSTPRMGQKPATEVRYHETREKTSLVNGKPVTRKVTTFHDAPRPTKAPKPAGE